MIEVCLVTFNCIIHLVRLQLIILGQNMFELFTNSIEAHLILKCVHLIMSHVILPILIEGLDCIADPD